MNRTVIAASFPKTREQAEQIAANIKAEAWLQGCTCQNKLTVEFCQRGMDEFVRILHQVNCGMAHR